MILAAASGLLVIGGIWLFCSGLRRQEVRPSGRARRAITVPDAATPAGRLRAEQVLAALLAGSAVVLFTRWPVAGAGGAGAAWVVTGWMRRGSRSLYEARTVAIAEWAEMLRDGIGTARGIEGVLVATASSSPLPIRPALGHMANRLPYEPLTDVLDDLADDLDHPIGDLVVLSLRMAATAGGRQIRVVLSDLADTAHAEASARRRVSVARQRPLATMRYTALLILFFIVLLVVLCEEYLRPYRTVAGQIALLVIGGYWSVGFWWMGRMARPKPVARYLAANRRAPA